MPKITIDMNEHKKFFSSELGQAVLREMSKTDDIEILKALADCSCTSAGIIDDIVKKLTKSELSKLEGNGSYNEQALRVIMNATQNRNTSQHTLGMLYTFAMKLMEFQIGSIPYDAALDMLRWLSINPNTNEQTLRKIKTSNPHLIKYIVQNTGVNNKLFLELVEGGKQEEKLAAVPELIRRLKAKL